MMAAALSVVLMSLALSSAVSFEDSDHRKNWAEPFEQSNLQFPRPIASPRDVPVDPEPVAQVNDLSDAEYIHALSNFLFGMLLGGFFTLLVLADRRSHRVIFATLILLLIFNS